MNGVEIVPGRKPGRVVAGTLIRWSLGAVFVWLGFQKAIHPVDFLKVVREYQLGGAHQWLNLIAGVLPWFEMYCGALLLVGVAVRGTVVLVLGMLIPFTWMIAHRALGIHEAGTIPFCAIRFDCGCGAGEVNVCRKLFENGSLVLLAAVLLVIRSDKWALRHDLARGR